MSTSPTRYYASRPGSRAGSRPTSPPSSAQVRSQAVAKLKRAASLPRTPDGRRPAQPQGPQSTTAQTYNTSPQPQHAGPSRANSPSHSGHEEVLSPSPVATHFQHDMSFPSPAAMQRSASAASSFHTPSATPMVFSHSASSPYHSANSSMMSPDWSAMQLAQSYLPSLSPAGLSPNPYQQQQQQSIPGSGRNTPSPLPSLGEIRTLQRSNSNAARAKAMSKLTGGKSSLPTPDNDDNTTYTRVNLHRAGTVGGQSRTLGVPLITQTPSQENDIQLQDASLAEPRPRLQRSFTVSSTNMGEERRSAVGRRMVERLAERKAAREKEEAEVRRLWEERRQTSAPEQEDGVADIQSHDMPAQQEGVADIESHEAPAQQEEMTDDDQDERSSNDLGNDLPTFARHSPIDPARHVDVLTAGPDLLAAPDRPASHVTMRSTTEPFEYESHLRRSLSSRTARGADGAVVEPLPSIVTPDQLDEEIPNRVEQLHLTSDSASNEQDNEPLLLPQPPYATPTRHVPHSSTSTVTTLHGSQSPGGSSTLSGLDSMMFVMGGTGGASQAGLTGSGRLGEGNWPSEVDGGSDWGTPAKDLHQATFADSPSIASPSHPGEARLSANGSSSGEGGLSPRQSTRTDSVMSWEEVGGREDQEVRVPTDKRYHNKSGSISAKIGRTMRNMRKRSQSRSSVTSSSMSPPTSPRQGAADKLHIAVSNFSRRESESSIAPSQGSVSRSLSRNDHTARHQPSISSLAPSSIGQPDSSANNMLLQHQLSNEPSQVSFLPRANLSDPRVLNSKLSPFPGITQFEPRRMQTEGALSPGEAPKLLHQLSDSLVPSQQRVTPAGTGSDSIYALPLPAQTDDSRRSSADSMTKRNWLSKAFGQQTSPRSSISASRKGSISEPDHNRNPHRKMSKEGLGDPFAAPPPPSLKPSRHRSASPSVSIVPEDNEEGVRTTKFTSTHRVEIGSPVPEDEEDKPSFGLGFSQKSMDVLNKMDEVLALAPDDPARPDILDDPPRKLLISTQVLQVVNVHTVKDRYLFLFNDILVITKPIIPHGITATLDMRYIVKSVVSLDKLAISGFADETTVEPERHPVVANFIQRFSEDPAAACRYLVDKSSPKVDSVTLASLIFKTPELDKRQIGNLLASNEGLMAAFIDRFHFTGVRIDSALRMFLLSLRLPTEPTACETLLRGFAYRYFEANQNIVSYDRELAADLVLTIMQCNDALYGTFGFALINPAVTQDTFISAFQSRDSQRLVSVELLSDIYSSLRSTRLVQALSTNEADRAKEVIVSPARMPSKLTYHVWSNPITLKIPDPDPSFKIRLLGEGLELDPPLLDFTTCSEQSFRVRGTALGTKSLLFDRIGENAALYGNLGNTRHFTVERAFMRNTFHVAFTSHTGLKRKYCFSVNDAEMRRRWRNNLERQIQLTRENKARSANGRPQAIRQTAEAVSLQVLRDALIPPEDKTAKSNSNNNSNATPTPINGNSSLGRANSSNGRSPVPNHVPASEKERGRSGSISVVYAQQSQKEEKDLGLLQPTRTNTNVNVNDSGNGGAGGEEKKLVEIQNGKELVLLCRQNSLLPGLLELLHAGREDTGYGNGIVKEGYTNGVGLPSRSDSIRINGRATRL